MARSVHPPTGYPARPRGGSSPVAIQLLTRAHVCCGQNMAFGCIWLLIIPPSLGILCARFIISLLMIKMIHGVWQRPNTGIESKFSTWRTWLRTVGPSSVYWWTYRKVNSKQLWLPILFNIVCPPTCQSRDTRKHHFWIASHFHG